MIPPLVRRCPDCGHVGPSRRFVAIGGAAGRLVACPACGHRFEPFDAPWLA